MRFSGKPDPLTSEEKVRVEQFYRKVLRDGFAPWPLDGSRLPIFIDGKMRKIYSDTRWACQEEYIYIGSRLDEGSGDFSSPAARLAVTSALMGMTGHSTSSELIGLLSERLAKVMAGVYEAVVKPLAETSDSRPVRRMAWSASGGLASWIDGEWVGLTGEPVVVGTGWTVIDTEEGPIEEGLPPVQSGRVEGTRIGGYAEMVREYNLSESFEDGVQTVGCSRESFDILVERGYTGIAYDPVRQGIVSTEIVPATPTLTHAQWEEIKGRFDRWAASWFTGHTPDGRTTVRFSESRSDLEARIASEGLTGCVVELNFLGEEAITYPPEPLPDVEVRGYDELLRDRSWGDVETCDGIQYIPINEAAYNTAITDGYVGIRFDNSIGIGGGIVRA